MLGKLTRRRVRPIGRDRADRSSSTDINVLGAEKAGHVGRRRTAEELRWLARLEQSPLVDENSDVADESRFGEVVGDVQHRTAPLEVDRPHLAPNGGPAARIERANRPLAQE